MKQLPIDLDRLATEMENESRAGYLKLYLDTETGEIIEMEEDLAIQFEDSDEPDPDDQMAWEREEYMSLLDMQEDSERYASVPILEPLERLEHIKEYIATVKNSKLKTALKKSLHGNDPHSRFAQALNKDPKEKNRWTKFHEGWVKSKVLHWLTLLEIEAVEE